MDLYEFMSRYKDRLTPVVAAVVLRELLEGLKFLKRRRIAHRDLKPENVLVDVAKNEVVVKICDFNLCAFLPPESSILSGFVGTTGFFAPEVLLTGSFCALKADVYSFGCIALEVLTSPKFFSGVWMAAFACVQTVDAPNFSQAVRLATTEAHRELRKHGVGALCDAVLHALALQPALRATPASLRANAWIAGASKFQAADTLNDRQPRKFVDVPLPAPSLDLSAGGAAAFSNAPMGGQKVVGVLRAASPQHPKLSPSPTTRGPPHQQLCPPVVPLTSQLLVLPFAAVPPQPAPGNGQGHSPAALALRKFSHASQLSRQVGASEVLPARLSPPSSPPVSGRGLGLHGEDKEPASSPAATAKLPLSMLALAANNIAHLRRAGGFSNCGGASGSQGRSLSVSVSVSVPVPAGAGAAAAAAISRGRVRATLRI